MWTYAQREGTLYRADGELIGTGYSGFPPGRNAPAWQAHQDVGPIPQGLYTIGEPECVDVSGPHGPFVLPLEPDAGNEMFGRSAFLCHGDGIGPHAGSASHGCIILPRAVREVIAASGDHRLRVVDDSRAILPAPKGTT